MRTVKVTLPYEDERDPRFWLTPRGYALLETSVEQGSTHLDLTEFDRQIDGCDGEVGRDDA